VGKAIKIFFFPPRQQGGGEGSKGCGEWKVRSVENEKKKYLGFCKSP